MVLQFLEERGFTAEPANGVLESKSSLMSEEARPYFRDYISNRKTESYQSLHITFYDNCSRTYTEIQLRTKEMDDAAEIGSANHQIYEQQQEKDRSRKDRIPEWENRYFEEAYERGLRLMNLQLEKLDVNMFTAINHDLVNDGCGLYRGRLILPYEHLSRFQNDRIDWFLINDISVILYYKMASLYYEILWQMTYAIKYIFHNGKELLKIYFCREYGGSGRYWFW